MKENIEISLFGVVGSHLCVASSDGQKVYERLVTALNKNLPVSLSFRNVSVLTPAFLNTAIGQLYGKFDETTIRELLKVEDIEPDDAVLLKRVVSTAKLYFQDKAAFKQALRELPKTKTMKNKTVDVPSRLGFMTGQTEVPDDFDSMGTPEIEKMFRGARE